MHVPTSVTLRPDGVHIEWDDGSTPSSSISNCGGACPCAACVHELTGKRMVGPGEVPQNVEALDHMPVGRYALQLLWSDAHDTGIYPYNLLRRISGLPED